MKFLNKVRELFSKLNDHQIALRRRLFRVSQIVLSEDKKFITIFFKVLVPDTVKLSKLVNDTFKQKYTILDEATDQQLKCDDKNSYIFNFKYNYNEVNGTNFIYCIFLYEANFIEATFNENASFNLAIFNEKTHFNKATFNEKAQFMEAIFTKEACFSLARFTEVADFSQARFIKEANFYNATFTNQAYFNKATFDEKAQFYQAKFIKEGQFYQASFTKEAYFNKATFNEKAYFKDLSITKTSFLDFQQSTIDNVYFSLIHIPLIGFLNLNFSLRHIALNIDLKFADIDKFNIGDMTFKASNRETYTILKDIYLKKNDRIKALEYHQKEMDKALEQAWKQKTADRFLLSLEKGSNNFGLSWALPLFWLFILNFLFVLFVYLPNAYKHPELILDLKSVVLEFLKNLLPYTKLDNHLSTTQKVFAILKNLLNVFLIYQFIISVRKYNRKL